MLLPLTLVYYYFFSVFFPITSYLLSLSFSPIFILYLYLYFSSLPSKIRLLFIDLPYLTYVTDTYSFRLFSDHNLFSLYLPKSFYNLPFFQLYFSLQLP